MLMPCRLGNERVDFLVFGFGLIHQALPATHVLTANRTAQFLASSGVRAMVRLKSDSFLTAAISFFNNVVAFMISSY
jgi:hypothetical protein